MINLDGLEMPEQLLNNNAYSRQQNDATNKSSIPPDVLIDMQKNNIFNTTSNQDDTIDRNEPAVPIRKDKILQALENIGQRKISQNPFRGEMTQG
jgi:hypothetical protein